jgi:hypothetical protein
MTITHEATPVADAVPEPKPKKAKKAKARAALEPATEQPTPEPSEPAATKTKPKKLTKRPLITMKLLSERYIQHLSESGKSQGTALSYLIEMTTATKFLGEDTAIASLTPDDVRRFNDSRIVMFKRDGKTPKAAPSYLKTQRVLRLALVWAAEQGWIETAPIPADEK